MHRERREGERERGGGELLKHICMAHEVYVITAHSKEQHPNIVRRYLHAAHVMHTLCYTSTYA